MAWLLTGYLLSASVGTSIIGRLGDMYGKERLLLITLVLLAVGTLVSALSTSLDVMVLGRIIQGAGGGIFPLAFGIVRDEFPADEVPGSIGILSSILGIGGGVGIVLGGLIIEHLNYHWLYWIPLVVIVVVRGRHLALRARVARPRPRQDQLGRGGADDDRLLLRADLDLGDDLLGLGFAQDADPARRRAWPSRPPG